MSTAWNRTFALFFVFAFAATASATDQYDAMLRRVPMQTNTLVLIDVAALHNCPLGKIRNWAKKHEAEYLSGATHMPPSASKIVLASQFDPKSLANSWEVGLADLKKDVSMAKLADKEGGSLSTIAGLEAVLSLRNAYFVQFAPRLVGSMHPATRQDVARWIRFAKDNKQPMISPYLQTIVANAPASEQMVMAFDLSEVLDGKEIRNGLTNARCMQGISGDNFKTLAASLTGLQGLKLGVSVDDSIHGTMRFDFADPVGPMASIIKALFLEALADRGAMIEDFQAWKASGNGNTVTLEGRFTPRSLRQVISIIEAPIGRFESETPAGSEGADPKLAASMAYFRGITTLIEDLRYKQSGRNASWTGTAYWFEKYAKQIDNLPVLNVDPDLLTYGAKTSQLCRALAQSLRGVNIAASTLQAYKDQGIAQTGQASWGYSGYYGYGGWSVPTYGYANNYAQIRAQQDQYTTKGSADRVEVWRMIDDATAEIRRKMTEKFKVEFKTKASDDN